MYDEVPAHSDEDFDFEDNEIDDSEYGYDNSDLVRHQPSWSSEEESPDVEAAAYGAGGEVYDQQVCCTIEFNIALLNLLLRTLALCRMTTTTSTPHPYLPPPDPTLASW